MKRHNDETALEYLVFGLEHDGSLHIEILLNRSIFSAHTNCDETSYLAAGGLVQVLPLANGSAFGTRA